MICICESTHTCVVDGIYDSGPCSVRAVAASNAARACIVGQHVVLIEVATCIVPYSSLTRGQKVTVVQEEGVRPLSISDEHSLVAVPLRGKGTTSIITGAPFFV